MEYTIDEIYAKVRAQYKIAPHKRDTVIQWSNSFDSFVEDSSEEFEIQKIAELKFYAQSYINMVRRKGISDEYPFLHDKYTDYI